MMVIPTGALSCALSDPKTSGSPLIVRLGLMDTEGAHRGTLEMQEERDGRLLKLLTFDLASRFGGYKALEDAVREALEVLRDYVDRDDDEGYSKEALSAWQAASDALENLGR